MCSTAHIPHCTLPRCRLRLFLYRASRRALCPGGEPRARLLTETAITFPVTRHVHRITSEASCPDGAQRAWHLKARLMIEPLPPPLVPRRGTVRTAPRSHVTKVLPPPLCPGGAQRAGLGQVPYPPNVGLPPLYAPSSRPFPTIRLTLSPPCCSEASHVVLRRSTARNKSNQAPSPIAVSIILPAYLVPVTGESIS